ncbi:hypothetical protein ANSO36C_65950 (plasmid) [Nostoc cf. commune SO-36]|uniref:Uncharacterized protein n=1 Tax=Nostoc cf. commune SO-36 TaxID=449208 RepID=A0ABM7ZBW5_NOSCO|nr:hypothetical protein ANSO36C_65950 [Nostoc cf. commune SO-36]
MFGVATRNGLLLVDNYNNKFAQGMHLKDVIVKGSLERINAILMTALSSALGMLPLAIAGGAGNEILQPLAIVVFLGWFVYLHGINLVGHSCDLCQIWQVVDTQANPPTLQTRTEAVQRS